MLTLVLRPKGNLRLTGGHEVESRHRWTRAAVAWRVVELWTVPAGPLRAAGDVGLVPWVPLAQYDGPPEALLQQCRERIDRDAPAAERPSLLAVSQVMTRLR